MTKFARAAALWLLVILALTLGQHASQAAEQRFALVIGNDEYRAAKLATSANDAGLVADALQSAGFTVTGARNLDQATLRESFREFIGQVSAAGPDAVALVYLAGIGLQFNGENYFVPVDADIQRDVDVPLQAIRVSDFTQPLASLPGRVKIVILDAARQNPFGGGNQPLAGGLALVEPMPSMAIAFNAAPGTVAPDEQGPYGAYATSLTEMIAAGGLGLDDLFARLRLRVSDLTQGAEIPWYASQIDGPFFMTELAAGAPPPPNVMPIADVRAKSIRDFPNVDDAYAAALDRDTIDGYQQFLAVYPHSPYSERIAGMLAVRREAIIWRRCVIADTPPAYWSYLRRYPNGPHVWDARRRLAMLAAAYDPPPDFAYYDFGVPPPPPDELGYVDQPVIIFAGPRYAPPPRPPLFFLPPRPREYAVLPPPPPQLRSASPCLIPARVRPFPRFARPPRCVEFHGPPPGAPGAAPGGRELRVSLPTAVTHAPPPGAPPGAGFRPAPGNPSTLAPLPAPPRSGPGGPPPPAPPPSNALVKPGFRRHRHHHKTVRAGIGETCTAAASERSAAAEHGEAVVTSAAAEELVRAGANHGASGTTAAATAGGAGPRDRTPGASATAATATCFPSAAAGTSNGAPGAAAPTAAATCIPSAAAAGTGGTSGATATAAAAATSGPAATGSSSSAGSRRITGRARPAQRPTPEGCK